MNLDPETQIPLVSGVRQAHPFVRLLAMGIESLTSRESEIARYLIAGYTNVQIADTLGIGESTVKTHIDAIFSKLGAVNRTHAAVLCALYDIRCQIDAEIQRTQEAVATLAADTEFM